MSQIAPVTFAGGAGPPPDGSPDGLAIGKLVDVTDELIFNFVLTIDFGCMGILFSGTFGGGVVEHRGGINIGPNNPPTVITDPADATHSVLSVSSVGMYFHHVYTDTMRFALVGGTIAVTDIDVTVFAPQRVMYSNSQSVGIV